MKAACVAGGAMVQQCIPQYAKGGHYSELLKNMTPEEVDESLLSWAEASNDLVESLHSRSYFARTQAANPNQSARCNANARGQWRAAAVTRPTAHLRPTTRRPLAIPGPKKKSPNIWHPRWLWAQLAAWVANRNATKSTIASAVYDGNTAD